MLFWNLSEYTWQIQDYLKLIWFIPIKLLEKSKLNLVKKFVFFNKINQSIIPECPEWYGEKWQLWLFGSCQRAWSHCFYIMVRIGRAPFRSELHARSRHLPFCKQAILTFLFRFLTQKYIFRDKYCKCIAIGSIIIDIHILAFGHFLW